MTGNLLTMHGKEVTDQVSESSTDRVSDPATDPEALISPRAAGEIYGCTKNNIVNHITGKSKPVLKAVRGNNNEWRIKRRDFDDWLKAKRGNTLTDPATRASGPPSVPVSVTPLSMQEGVYAVKIEGLEARLADAQATISDLRTRLDTQATAHKEAIDVMETRHQEALAAEASKRETAEARIIMMLEDKVASAEKIGQLEGRTVALEAQVEKSTVAYAERDRLATEVATLQASLEKSQRAAQDAQKAYENVKAQRPFRWLFRVFTGKA